MPPPPADAMPPSRNELVKSAVRANFDASPADYDAFEEATGLFSFLARELVSSAGLGFGMKVVDVGCGTGLSTAIIREVVGSGSYLAGIDLSPGMLEQARRRVPGARFIEGDAESLESLFPAGSQDALLYTACVFLLPDAPASFRGARTVLRDGGIAAMNFIAGAYSGGRELFTELFPEWTGGAAFPSPRFPCDTSRLEEYLSTAGFRDIRRGTVEKEMGIEGLRRFYSVPAQSASLYPKMDVAGRRAAVGKMFDLAVEKGVRSASMRWSWLAARK